MTTRKNADGAEQAEKSGQASPRRKAARRPTRKQVLLRLDPAVHEALVRWAEDEFRSVNAQIELTLRRALMDAGRMPKSAAPIRRQGRPAAGE